jgi:hypothetical protein
MREIREFMRVSSLCPFVHNASFDRSATIIGVGFFIRATHIDARAMVAQWRVRKRDDAASRTRMRVRPHVEMMVRR